MWFSRWRRRKPPPFDFSTLPWAEPPEEADAREEGVMLAEYSSRMVLKNRILVSVLGESIDFDIDSFLPDARDALAGLAAEMRGAARGWPRRARRRRRCTAIRRTCTTTGRRTS